MDQKEIKDTITKINVLWENISRESSSDLSSYDYISIKSMSLKMLALTLKECLEEIIEEDNEAKIKFIRLHKSLHNIVSILNHKHKIDKDKEYIESILGNILKIKNDVDVLKMYL